MNRIMKQNTKEVKISLKDYFRGNYLNYFSENEIENDVQDQNEIENVQDQVSNNNSPY